MVNGVANSIKSVVACYPVATLTKELLHRFTWEVIGMLEGVGIKIISLVCDGAGVNRAFYQMLKPVTITESGVIFDTVNLYAPHRVLYLMQDPPHLLKTSRNCLNNSGKKNKKGQYIRIMQKNGQDVVWGSIVRLYQLESGNTVRMLFKLNQEDVYLNAYSVMRVSLAAHVLSQSVADALRNLNWTECEELAKFCETMNEFFDILNGAHSHQGHREKNDNFNPFRDAEDPRFKRLEEIWEYFDDWKKDAYKTAEDYLRKQGQKITRTRLDAEAHKRTLSTETLNGVERTIRGFIGAMKFVLKKSEDGDMKPYIMAKAFQQDDLENYFSKLRSRLGGNRHPDLSELLRCHARLHVQSKLSFRGSKRTNAGSRSMPSLEDISKPLPKRTRKKLY